MAAQSGSRTAKHPRGPKRLAIENCWLRDSGLWNYQLNSSQGMAAAAVLGCQRGQAIHLSKNIWPRGLPRWSSGEDATLPLQGRHGGAWSLQPHLALAPHSLSFSVVQPAVASFQSRILTAAHCLCCPLSWSVLLFCLHPINSSSSPLSLLFHASLHQESIP